MSGPSLQRLRVFVTVVDQGGVGAAARELDMAQSTVSAHLRHLEAETGSRLVARESGVLAATPAGRVLLGPARTMLATYADAVVELQRLGHGPVGGTLAIGGTATAGEGVLPRLLVEYARLHPLVDLDLRIDNTAETLRLLDRGDIGLAVTADTGVAIDHDTVLVAEERQVVIAPPGHPLAGDVVAPRLLQATPVLLREHGSATRETQLTLLAAWGLTGVGGARTWTVGSTSAIVRAVAAGLGVACVTASAADAALRLGQVVELHLDPAPPPRPVHLVLRRGRPRTRAEDAFVDLISERSTA